MNAITKTTWTPEMKAELERLYTTSGLSARMIGEVLGVGKNAVIGTANRMGLCRTEKNPVVKKAPGKMTARTKLAKKRKVKRDLLKTTKKQFDQEDHSHLRVENGCRFIQGDPKQRPDGLSIDDLYCGLPRQPGKSYCEHHEGRTHIAGSALKVRK